MINELSIEEGHGKEDEWETESSHASPFNDQDIFMQDNALSGSPAFDFPSNDESGSESGDQPVDTRNSETPEPERAPSRELDSLAPERARAPSPELDSFGPDAAVPEPERAPSPKLDSFAPDAIPELETPSSPKLNSGGYKHPCPDCDNPVFSLEHICRSDHQVSVTGQMKIDGKKYRAKLWRREVDGLFDCVCGEEFSTPTLAKAHITGDHPGHNRNVTRTCDKGYIAKSEWLSKNPIGTTAKDNVNPDSSDPIQTLVVVPKVATNDNDAGSVSSHEEEQKIPPSRHNTWRGLHGLDTLQKNDIDRLLPTKWLNDELINCFAAFYLAGLDAKNPSVGSRIQVFSSFLYNKAYWSIIFINPVALTFFQSQERQCPKVVPEFRLLRHGVYCRTNKHAGPPLVPSHHLSSPRVYRR
ncbi:hypothetical protein B0H12DRAFT_46417 [Mycena haematopus]|nr:hypothetical protein B0H12DRAFT_46417 [Mycena haematopus]